MKVTLEKLITVAAALIVFTASHAEASMYIQSESSSLGIISWFMKLAQPVIQAEVSGLVGILMWNPTIYCYPPSMGESPNCRVSAGLDKLLPYFIDILIPLYIAAILFTALYFIVKSTNPRGRARAKSMLSKLLFSMVLVVMSPIIYQTMIDLSYALVNSMYKNPSLGLQDMSSLTKAATGGELFGVCCLVIFVLLVIAAAAIMAAVRYYVVVVFGAIFPILLFLYFFDLTRSWGRKYIRESFNWIFTPVMQMFWLAFAMKTLDATGPIFTNIDPAVFGTEIMGAVISLGMALVGFTMVAISPLIMNHLMNLVGGGVFAVGVATNTPWATVLGGIMQGREDAGLHAAKSVLTRATPMLTFERLGWYGYGVGSGMDITSPPQRSVSMLTGEEAKGGAPRREAGRPGAPGGRGPSARGEAAKAVSEEMKAIKEGTGVTGSPYSPTGAPPEYEGKRPPGLPKTLGEALKRTYPGPYGAGGAGKAEAAASAKHAVTAGVPLAVRPMIQPQRRPSRVWRGPQEDRGERLLKKAEAAGERKVLEAEKEIARERAKLGFTLIRRLMEQPRRAYEAVLNQFRKKAAIEREKGGSKG